MTEIKVNSIKFKSYFLAIMGIYFAFGVTIGLLAFLLSLVGCDVSATVGTTTITGMRAGIVNIFLAPVIMLIFGAILALISYLPVKYLLKLTKGVVLRGEFAGIDDVCSEPPHSPPPGEEEDKPSLD